ncbi:MAG: sigma-70 family RNA polymerase sigma factor [bacterium]|nr:sigma-70 family RNA polymerase sigma factor [bacterium]
MVDLDDIQLVERTQQGDQQAFSQLFAKYQKKVFNLCFRFVDDYEEARDLTQETFVRVYNGIKNFRREASFSTWLYCIASNTCKNKLRHWKTQPNLMSLDETFETEDDEMTRQVEDKNDPTPLAKAETREIQDQVQTAIKTLSAEHREVIILRDIQGCSYEEIAATLGCNLGTVKSRLSRARLELKDLLKEVM